MIKEMTCIVCPMGCQLKARFENGEIRSVEGNTCPRGEVYAKTELTNPTRVITTTVRTKGGKMVSVKTNGAVPKERMFECMEIINRLHPLDEVCEIGNVIYENILGCGVNVVATSSAKRS